ncbi:MAG: hypothetical protein RI907_45 [Pseudomonadota bacterium]|jgi:hypothetical protein
MTALQTTAPALRRHALASASALCLLLTACGGGGGSSNSNSGGGGGSTTVAATQFPLGVSVASPTSLSNASAVVASSQASGLPWTTRMAHWAQRLGHAIATGDSHLAGRLLASILPIGSAQADATKVPEALEVASKIEAVAEGSITLTGAGLDVTSLFNTASSNASCFGPQMPYASHQDGSPTSGTLPSGDLGIWKATEAGEPCAAAQLNRQLTGVKNQYRQGMFLMAALRHAIGSTTGLALPTGGTSVNATTAMATKLSSAAPGVTVNMATVSLNPDGSEYTYRLVISQGTGESAQQAEVVVYHRPGESDSAFAGNLHITTSRLGNDMAFGCTDETVTVPSVGLRYRVATATTVRYELSGDTLDFSARSANYCGAPVEDSLDHMGDIATLDSDRELDLTEDLGGSATHGSVKGWRGNASRFAGSLNKATQAGNFLYVWQAGNNDGRGRAFAVNATYDSATEARAMSAFYSYTSDGIGYTDGSMASLICNWAGPSNSHSVSHNLFQSQTATLGASSTAWSAGTSHIVYAPTNSCSSTTTSFDLDGNGTLDTNEGVGTSHDLDGLTTGTNVYTELGVRGYSQPRLFTTAR